ncbi:MAG: methionyl-tRNA formyltransferase [Ignavibacteria bacterium]|nr:methionyl-tRNA formyltransferase [Ignavibacteria bacterium]
MKFVYLAHSEMSMHCLEGLIERSYVPEACIVSIAEGKHDSFLSGMKVICGINGIRLLNVCDNCTDPEVETVSSLDGIAEIMSGADLGISVGFMKILPKKIFSAPAHGTVNLHCGKLPQFRGRAPISRAILEGEESITVSVHMMNEKMDAGDVICEIELPLSDKDDVNTMYEKCSEVSAGAVVSAIGKVVSGKAVFRKQEPDLTPREKLTEAERRIDWKQDSRRIFNQVRAMTFPYPGAKFRHKGKEYVVLHAKAAKAGKGDTGRPGEVVDSSEKELTVATGSGSVVLRDLFLKGRLVKNIGKEIKKGAILSS